MSGDPSFPRSSPHDGGRLTAPRVVWEEVGRWKWWRWLYNDGRGGSTTMSRAREEEEEEEVSRDEIDKRKKKKKKLASTSHVHSPFSFLGWSFFTAVRCPDTVLGGL